MKADNIESIINFLSQNNIEGKNNPMVDKFNRVIEFTIDENTFFIEWWVNQSYLKINNEFSCPCMPFKYISVNVNSPTSKHSLQLCFYDEKNNDKDDFIYNEIPFGSFKIPFNNK